MQNESLSSSVNYLCIRLRPHQLLPEFDENIIRTANEHEFDWLKSAADIQIKHNLISVGFRT